MKKIITVSTFIAIVVLSIAFISCGSSGDGTPVGNLDNKRGIGYFVADDARETVLASQRKDFIEKEVPAIKQRMQLLGLDSSIFN